MRPHLRSPNRHPRSAPRPSSCKRSLARRGFTLVELLVVVTIIAILAAAILFAMFSSQEAARAAKTRSMIARLDSLIMPKYESYMTRRVPLRTPVGPNVTPLAIAQARLNVLREIMRLEMPERFSDILADPVNIIDSNGNRLPRPAANRAYLRRLMNSPKWPNLQHQYADAECLFLIVSMGIEEDDAMSFFAETDISDLDQDGLKEFLDGWGNPIGFLRWAPGFQSPLQNQDPTKEYDQFDVRRVQGAPNSPFVAKVAGAPVNFSQIDRVQSTAFSLFPLIYSAGPDGEYDITTDSESGKPKLSYAAPPANHKANDPFITVVDSSITPVPVGYPNDANGNKNLESNDNITNHDLGVR